MRSVAGGGPFALALVALNACQELPLSVGVAPGVCLKPPALDRLQQGREITSAAELQSRQGVSRRSFREQLPRLFRSLVTCGVAALHSAGALCLLSRSSRRE